MVYYIAKGVIILTYKLLSSIYYQDNTKKLHQQEYTTRYNSPAAVHIDFQIHHNPAFYLNTAEITGLISDIYTNLRTMERTLDKLPGAAQSFYSQTCLIDEIILSNDIEHVYSSRKDITDVLSVLNDPTTAPVNMRLFGMVHKYSLLSEAEAAIPLVSPADIRRIYDELILPEITQPEDIPDGQLFRSGAVNVISATGKVKHSGIYGEDNIIQALSQALSVLNLPGNQLINIAIFHYLFGYIHPFYEGNGRLSRFISSQKLADLLHPLVACRLSYAVKNNLSAYYDAFDRCNDPKNMGDLTPFIIMFLRVINQAINSLSNKIADGYEKLEHYSRALLSLNLPDKPSGFVYVFIQQALFAAEEPFTIYDIAEISNFSVPSCRNTINHLVAQGIPIVITSAGRLKLYTINLDKLDELTQPTGL